MSSLSGSFIRRGWTWFRSPPIQSASLSLAIIAHIYSESDSVRRQDKVEELNPRERIGRSVAYVASGYAWPVTAPLFMALYLRKRYEQSGNKNYSAAAAAGYWV